MRTQKQNLITSLLYAICGAVLALPAIFNNLWFLGWIAYVPVLTNELLRQDSDTKPYKQAWLRGLAFFYGYGLTLFYWLWELYPLDFAGFDPISALFIVLLGWLGIPLIQGIVSAFNIVAIHFFKQKNISLVLYPITAAFIWIFLEWMQTLTWAGIPWGKLALGQTGLIYNIQSASLFGSYFISFLMICVAGYISLFIKHIKDKSFKRSALALMCVIVIFSSNFVYGVVALNNETQPIDTVTAAAVQGNVESAEKWNEDPMKLLEKHKLLTVEASFDGADLIVLAETAIPYVVNEDYMLTPYINSMAQVSSADLIIGCLHRDESNSLYNATRYANEDDGLTDAVYYKRKPVPFGEYMPGGDIIGALFPMLEQINLLSSSVSAGTTTSIFETNSGKVGSLICFDSIYETLALQTVRDGAELLAVSTNDCWFRDSAAIYQHNAHSILRAIETGRYVVRSANTGMSSIITDKGEIIKSLEPLVDGYVLSEVKMLNHKTLYVYVGNSIITIAFLWIVIMGFLLIKKEKAIIKIATTANQSVSKKKKKKKKK